MTTVESQIYEFLRKGGKEFKALSCAIMVMERLLFEEKKSIYDIQVTKDIYPEVVKQEYRPGGEEVLEIAGGTDTGESHRRAL